MMRGIELTRNLSREDECNKKPDNECGEKHKFRVANATLEIAIDVNTDFKCEAE